ncbi:MAG: ABC transporter ATPase [Bacteroidetes bacterium MedPE-SWsnd-G1]|nr:MAG: ABC transporter ATPase [Bacteroidetes bacterium MedPE-SWsnd-G1]
MFVTFESLPKNARVWVYQSNREFSKIESEKINESLMIFVNSWQRHGEDLKASFRVKYNQFIVLAVDENVNEASGCSIDSSVRTIKLIEDEFNLDLMNKLNIAFRIGENINTVSMMDFQNYLKEGKINSETIVFNNMVQSKEELNLNWEVPIHKSWHNRFLNLIKS